jgi:hypothetical protein
MWDGEKCQFGFSKPNWHFFCALFLKKSKGVFSISQAIQSFRLL